MTFRQLKWHTLLLVRGDYLLWWELLTLYPLFPWLSTGLPGLCLALRLSLQHELIHGHPSGPKSVLDGRTVPAAAVGRHT